MTPRVPGESPPAGASKLSQLAASPQTIIKVWAVSAILNVLFLASILVLGLLYAANSNQLHQQNAALYNSSVSQCRANNANRAQDFVIWTALEKPTAPRNAAARAKWAKLTQLVEKKDAPRNCIKVYAP